MPQHPLLGMLTVSRLHIPGLGIGLFQPVTPFLASSTLEEVSQ